MRIQWIAFSAGVLACAEPTTLSRTEEKLDRVPPAGLARLTPSGRDLDSSAVASFLALAKNEQERKALESLVELYGRGAHLQPLNANSVALEAKLATLVKKPRPRAPE